MDDHQHDSRCIVCSHVAEEGLPVLHVIHTGDGHWQFRCGAADHEDASTARVACRACMLKQDLSLAAADDLPADWELLRDAGDGRWRLSPLESD